VTATSPLAAEVAGAGAATTTGALALSAAAATAGLPLMTNWNVE
jgi:hypothetical protein